MPWTLDEKFRTPDNAAVVAFVDRENPSAHDEVASALIDSARGLADVEWYCPDTRRYAYVVLHTQRDRIFGIAFGMRGIAFRVPAEAIADACATGGELAAEIGAAWVQFDLHAHAALRRWCAIALDHAHSSPLDRPRRSEPRDFGSR